MFSIFKRKSPIEKLQKKMEALLQESFELSSVNRTKSDEKIYEAEQIAAQIQQLKKTTPSS